MTTDTPFNRVAEIYSRVRPDYPPRVRELICEYAGRDRFGTAVDVGSGAGASLGPLSDIADRVIGIEPGDRLRAEAEAKFPGIDIKPTRAEETGLDDACADLVTCATAFRWLDREAALNEFHRILKPGGTLAVYGYHFPIIAGPGHVVINRHNLRHWMKHRSPVLMRYNDKYELIAASGGFEDVRREFIAFTVQSTAESTARYYSSTSYGSAYIATIDDPEGYLERIREELAAVQPEPFELAFEIEMVLARKAD